MKWKYIQNINNRTDQVEERIYKFENRKFETIWSQKKRN
jgi:hypothetical protein